MVHEYSRPDLDSPAGVVGGNGWSGLRRRAVTHGPVVPQCHTGRDIPGWGLAALPRSDGPGAARGTATKQGFEYQHGQP